MAMTRDGDFDFSQFNGVDVVSMNFINDNKTYFRKVLIHMFPLQVTVSFHFYNTMDKVLLVCLRKKSSNWS